MLKKFAAPDEKFQPSLSISRNKRQTIEQNLDEKPDILFHSGKFITECYDYTHKIHQIKKDIITALCNFIKNQYVQYCYYTSIDYNVMTYK